MYGTYCRLNVPVWASNLEVLRAARKKLTAKAKHGPTHRTARQGFYREMLKYHAHEQRLCVEFRL